MKKTHIALAIAASMTAGMPAIPEHFFDVENCKPSNRIFKRVKRKGSFKKNKRSTARR